MGDLSLKQLKSRAKKYDLKAEFLNRNTLKVYSPKFFFDSWLIKESDEEFEVWHMSKKNNIQKCSYHLQAKVSKDKGIRTLQKIRSHNKYVAFHKTKTNMVDRVLLKEGNKIELS